MNVYLIRHGSNITQVLRHTDTDSFNDRPVKDRMLGVDIRLAEGETVELYLGYSSQSTTYLPLAIGTIEATLSEHADEHSWNLLLNGMLLAFIAFALMMTSVIGWRLSFSFSLYILAGSVFVFHADGYTYANYWPDLMHFSDPLNLSFMMLMPVFGLGFSRVLFNFKKFSPRLDTFLMFYMSCGVLIALFSIPIYESQLTKVIAYNLIPIGSCTQVVAGIVAVRKNRLGGIPYLIGALIVVASFLYAAFAHFLPGQFNLDTTLDFGHFSLLTESLAFAAAIALRLLGLRNERDRAIKAELKGAHEKLNLASDLQKSQDNFITARRQADMRRLQLSSVNHDLQQPLTSLRTALSKMRSTDEQASQQMLDAFDYLEQLAKQQIETNEVGEIKQINNLETFPIFAVLDNVHHMFTDEANAKGLRFNYRPSGLRVNTDPIGLMRAVSNLVSNAITHSGATQILLAARHRKNIVRIEVWDNGKGMTNDQLQRNMQVYKKGRTSSGSGLGLSIVNEFSTKHKLNFEIHTRSGHGSAAFLHLKVKFT